MSSIMLCQVTRDAELGKFLTVPALTRAPEASLGFGFSFVKPGFYHAGFSLDFGVVLFSAAGFDVGLGFALFF